MKKMLSVVATALMVLALVPGCGTTSAGSSASSGSTAKGDILVGGDLEMTGGTAMFGQMAKNAIEMAFQQVNDKGGILGGRKLKLVVADNKSDAGESTAAATKLVTQDKVVGVIGGMTSSVTLGAIPVVTDNKVPIISPSGTNTKLTINESGQLNKWAFRACFIDPFQGDVAAKFALGDKIKAKTAAIVTDQKSDYSKGLAKAFEEAFTKGGGKIIDSEQYVAGSDKDFRPILTKIKAANPDMVWVPGYYQEVGVMVKQARDMGMNIPFMGGDGWDDAKIFDIAGAKALNNTFYTDHVAVDDPAMAQFVKDYQAKYNTEPNAMAALGYDAAMMYVKAFETAGSTDSEKVRLALEGLKNFQGVSGNITIDPATHNPVKSAVIKENKDGKSVFLTKVNP